MGAYHTIDLELNRRFTLSKDHWDFVALERIGELCFASVVKFSSSWDDCKL